MGDLLHSVQLQDVFQSVDLRGEPSVEAEDLWSEHAYSHQVGEGECARMGTEGGYTCFSTKAVSGK